MYQKIRASKMHIAKAELKQKQINSQLYPGISTTSLSLIDRTTE
jgi:hypothetical protein